MMATRELTFALRAPLSDLNTDLAAAEAAVQQRLASISKLRTSTQVEAQVDEQSVRNVKDTIETAVRSSPLRSPVSIDEKQARSELANTLKSLRSAAQSESITIRAKIEAQGPMVGPTGLQSPQAQRIAQQSTAGGGLDESIAIEQAVGKAKKPLGYLVALQAAIETTNAAISAYDAAIADTIEKRAKAIEEGHNAIRRIPFVGGQIASIGETISESLIQRPLNFVGYQGGLSFGKSRGFRTDQQVADETNKQTAEQDKQNALTEAKLQRTKAALGGLTQASEAAVKSARDAKEANLSGFDRQVAALERQRSELRKAAEDDALKGPDRKMNESARTQLAKGEAAIDQQIAEARKQREKEIARSVQDSRLQNAAVELRAVGNVAEAERVELRRTIAAREAGISKLSGQEQENIKRLGVLQTQELEKRLAREKQARDQRFAFDVKQIELQRDGRTTEARREGIRQNFDEKIAATNDPEEKRRLATLRDKTLEADAYQERKTAFERYTDAVTGIEEDRLRRQGKLYEADLREFERSAKRKVEEARKQGKEQEAAAIAEVERDRARLKAAEEDRQRSRAQRIEDVNASTEDQQLRRNGRTTEADTKKLVAQTKREIEEALRNGDRELANALMKRARDAVRDLRSELRQTEAVAASEFAFQASGKFDKGDRVAQARANSELDKVAQDLNARFPAQQPKETSTVAAPAGKTTSQEVGTIGVPAGEQRMQTMEGRPDGTLSELPTLSKSQITLLERIAKATERGSVAVAG